MTKHLFINRQYFEKTWGIKMGIFSKPTAIGIFYNHTTDDCYGVKVELSSKTLHVKKAKSISLYGSDDAFSEQINNLVNDLAPNDETYVFASQADMAVVVDIMMPKLNLENLYNALLFEVPKYTPLSEEDIIWGYRVIKEVGDKLQVRLGIIEASKWEHLLNQFGHIKNGVEQIMPVELALDPFFGDKDFITHQESDLTVNYSLNADGLRHNVIVEGNDETNQFSKNSVDTTPVSATVNSVIEFDQAIACAAYGLTCYNRKHRTSWITLPQTIASKKKKSLFLINAILAVVCVALLLFSGYNWFAQNSKEETIYKSYKEKLNKEIKAITVEKADEQFLKVLEEEMSAALRNRKTFAQNMAKLTELIEDDYWLEKINWDGEKFDLSIRSSNPDNTVAKTLEETGLYENVSVKKNTANTGITTTSIKLSPVELQDTPADESEPKENK